MAEAAETNTTDKPWIATLIRGRSYVLGTTNPLHFTRGVDTPVDEATKQRLQRKAIQQVKTGTQDDYGDDEYEERCKFSFRKAGDPAPKSSGPGQRTRPAARRVHAT